MARGVTSRDRTAAVEAPLGLRQLKQRRTREAILAAAERLFLRQGFAATRIEAICRAAEISLGTFYNFFRSKQDLLIFFLSRDRERVSERIAQALAAPTDDPAGYLRGLLLADLSLDAPDFSRDLWREILAAMIQSAGEPATRAAIAAYRSGFRACLAEALEHLAAAGRLSSSAPRDPLIELLYSLTAYQFQEYVTGGLEHPEDLERRLDGLLRVALDPWCPAQPARPRRPRAIRPA